MLSGCGWPFRNRQVPPWFGGRDTNKLCWPLTCLSVRFQSTFGLTAFPKCLHTWVTESRVLKSKLVPWYSETVTRNPPPCCEGRCVLPARGQDVKGGYPWLPFQYPSYTCSLGFTETLWLAEQPNAPVSCTFALLQHELHPSQCSHNVKPGQVVLSWGWGTLVLDATQAQWEKFSPGNKLDP